MEPETTRSRPGSIRTGNGSAQFNQGIFILFSINDWNKLFSMRIYAEGAPDRFSLRTSGPHLAEGVTAYSPAVPKNQWHHVAIVRSAGQVRVYANGVGGAAVPNTQNFTDTSLTPFIGGAAAGVSAFEGLIDDLRITKGIARYTKNFLPPPAQLPAI
jgi:Laminin G domain.